MTGVEGDRVGFTDMRSISWWLISTQGSPDQGFAGERFR